MENAVQDIDKLELLLASGKQFSLVAHKIFADGKINFLDISHAPELVSAAIGLARALMAYEELLDEAKDLDQEELAKLASMFFVK